MNSELYFCNVNFDDKGQHVTSDVSLFSKLINNAKHTLYNYSYIKAEESLQVNLTLGELENCNYVIFDNSPQEKIKGAFIENVQYINENLSKVFIKIDYFHSYFHQVNLKPSFVEREHVLTDIPGKHTLDEGLEIGNYVQSSAEVNLYNGESSVLMMINALPKQGVLKEDGSYDESLLSSFANKIFGAFESVKGGVYDGVVCSNKILVFSSQYNGDKLYRLLKTFNDLGGTDFVQAIYLAPSDFIQGGSKNYSNGQEYKYSPYPVEVKKTVHFGQDLDGYYPKNKKLLCYPYNFARMQNGCGTVKEIKFENNLNNTQKVFGTLDFKSVGVVTTPAPVVKTFLISNEYFDEDDYITKSGWIQIPWNSNAFNAWLANNGGNLTSQIVGTLATVGMAVATKGSSILGGMAVGRVGDIINSIGNFVDKSKDISRSKGSQSGGVVDQWRAQMCTTVQRYTIKKEYAKIIDDFFSKFGYKVNEFKIPNVKSRNVFNYVKTNGLNLTGDVPEKAKEIIKNYFDNGLTIWHNYESMYNY